MVLLYILLILILFLALILFAPINLVIEYNEHLKIKIKFWGIPFPVYSGGKKKKITEKIEKKPKKRSKKHSAKKDIMLSIRKVGIILKSTQDSLRQVAKKIKINTLKLILYIGADDAAENAIRYGQASAIIYPAVSIINTLSKPEETIINIIPNFPSEKINADFKIDIKSSVFNILVLVIILFRNYKKINNL